jgi:uncharacterized lipoprotein YmbA
LKLHAWTKGAALAAVMLTACGSSPPLRYYALDVVAPAASAGRSPTTILIRVRHISLPPEMDHRGLTHHQGATQITISESDQWSAPLGELIQGALTRDLGERLGYEHVVAPGAQLVAVGQENLDLDFVALAADDTCGISAQVNWAVSVPNGTPQRGSARLSAPATSCPAGLPAALSAALGDLADQLSRQLPPP